MRKFCEKYKREIWVGVIVSLITAAIIKLGDWLITIAPSVGTSIFGTFSNIIYSLAATYTDNFPLRLIIFSGLGLLVGTTGSTIKKGINVYKSVLCLEKKTKDLPTERLNKITEDALLKQKAEKKSEKPESIPMLIQEGKQIGKNSILLVVLIVFMYLLIISFVTTPMSLHNKFEQDLVKIAPYVEEDEITQLKSDWVCMRSKSEYDVIYSTIDKAKENYSLPK